MTVERYLLPASMGGHECEIVWRSSLVARVEDAKVRYMIDGFEVTSEVLFSWLTRVKPALPEPPDGSVVRLSERGPVFARYDTVHTGDGHWYGSSPSGLLKLTWARVCELSAPAVPVLLVADPLAGEPVTLPYERRGTSPYIYVATDGDGTIGLTVGPREEDADGYEITNAEAREFARAVWAAANATERTSRDLG